MSVRLNKHLASLGLCSRRKADELIAAGRVKVNGIVVTALGVTVDPQTDVIELIGSDPLESAEHALTKEPLVYIALNKPMDYITSASSDQGQSVMDLLIPEHYAGRNRQMLQTRVFPVGRLDKDSEGLVLLTNDGDLANLLTHPRYEHEKEYEVWIDQPLSRESRAILQKGMILNGTPVQGITVGDIRHQGRQYIVTVILTEGKNRQIRKMFGRLGYRIQRLKRVRIAQLRLGALSVGRWKFVKKSQIVAK